MHHLARTVAATALAATTLGIVPGPAGATAPGAAAATASGTGTTRLTYVVDGCDGCRVQLTNAQQGDRARPEVWMSPTKTVRNGSVSFTVRSSRTWGLSTTIEAPWEGHTGYRTNLVQRYAGHLVGDAVTAADAQSASRASSCWAGTRQARVRIPVEVHRVEVDGVHGRVPGTLAFTTTTEDWQGGMRQAPGGVLGSQDVEVCR